MSEWHYTSGGAQLGPVSTGQLRELARAGRVTPGDLVWKEGMAEWVAASKLKGLFDGGVAAAVPQPAAAAVGPGEYDVQPAYQPPPAQVAAVAAAAAMPQAASPIGYYNPTQGLSERVARTLKGFPPATGMQGDFPLSEMQLAQLKEAEKQRKAIRGCASLLSFLCLAYSVIGIVMLFIGVAGSGGGRSPVWESGFLFGFGGVMLAFAFLAFFARSATLRCRIWAPITFIALLGLGLVLNLVSIFGNSPRSGPGSGGGGETLITAIVVLVIGGAFISVFAKALMAMPKFLASPVWAQEALVQAKL